MKQSAVSWLVEQLINDGKLIYDDYKAIEQAKEMEREQLLEEWKKGYKDACHINKYPSGMPG
jgi:hypothetical protein